MLQLGLITNTVLIHPSAQGLTLVGHAQQVLRWDQRSWPVLCPPKDPLASMLLVTATLLIQLEPEERSETLDKRFSAMRTVHGRASEAKGPSIRHPSLHKCTNVPSPWRSQMGWRGRRGGVKMNKEDILLLFFFLRRDPTGPEQCDTEWISWEGWVTANEGISTDTAFHLVNSEG